MEKIAHEFTDSLSCFLLENPASNERDWLKQLEQGQLSSLVDLLRLIVEERDVSGFSESDCINKITDAHLLVFSVNNIGKRRHISKIKPERQMKLISRILGDAQLTLISH